MFTRIKLNKFISVYPKVWRSFLKPINITRTSLILQNHPESYNIQGMFLEILFLVFRCEFKWECTNILDEIYCIRQDMEK